MRVSFPHEGEVADDFYHPSIELFSLIRKHLSQGLGITTQTVEREAFSVLSGAITEKLESKIQDKSKHFEYKSIAWNKCQENMRKLANSLLREPFDEEELAKNLYAEIYEFYKALERRALTDSDIMAIAYKQGAQQNAGMKKLIHDTIHGNLKQQNEQVLRLKRHHASPTDIKILAEAIQIKRRYESRGIKHHFLLASTDSTNFCPANTKYGPSRQVTDEIGQKYGIECDWPSEIFKKF